MEKNKEENMTLYCMVSALRLSRTLSPLSLGAGPHPCRLRGHMSCFIRILIAIRVGQRHYITRLNLFCVRSLLGPVERSAPLGI
jgi:hypothetical protein